ncbi:hypothetical protein [Bacillus mycoides]|nr:hypothetical protein [Bacillus mycoides]
MFNQPSKEYQYNIFLDILAEMVTNQLTKNEEENLLDNEKEGAENAK